MLFAPLAELDLHSQELMARLNVLHLIGCKVRKLTTGQKKLIAMIIALSSASLVTILEEPLQGLHQEDIPLVRRLLVLYRFSLVGVPKCIIATTEDPKLSLYMQKQGKYENVQIHPFYCIDIVYGHG